MGQKIHPLGFRLGITQTHKSFWFENKFTYPATLAEDYKIRSYIDKTLFEAGISKIEIYRTENHVDLFIYALRPGIIIGKSEDGIEKLKKHLKKCIIRNLQLRINVLETLSPDSDAVLIGEFISQQLEKRITFRKAARMAIQKAQKMNVQGIKIQVSGRLNGTEIARSEGVREGRVPLQTLRANIDYAIKRAQTNSGVLGIKVWVFNGELEPNYRFLREE